MILDLSAYLHITGKGIDEVQRRAYKLNLKKRSILILLDKPVTIEYLLSKTVFPQNDIVEELGYLVQEKFVLTSAEAVLTSFGQKAASTPHQTDGKLKLYEGFTLSEAQFLLIDFCVDSFKTDSQAIIDEINRGTNANDIRLCLEKIIKRVSENCAERLPILLEVVNEINRTI